MNSSAIIVGKANLIFVVNFKCSNSSYSQIYSKILREYERLIRRREKKLPTRVMRTDLKCVHQENFTSGLNRA